MMFISSRSRPAQPKPQPEKRDKVKIPESWELTPEQREFIESFNPAERKKIIAGWLAQLTFRIGAGF
ncbi:hypothetical protein ACFSKS_09780 [Pseudocitrobacter faecalis]